MDRQTGRTHEMVLEIKKTLEERGECGVGMLTNPTDILNRLEKLGLKNVTTKPAYRSMPPIMQFDNAGEPMGVIVKEKVHTGTVFYYDPEQIL